MRKFKIIGLFAIFFAHSAWAQMDCTISKEETTYFMQMDYQSFDQTFGSGWRNYAEQGCFLIASHLLNQYYIVRIEMDEYQKRVIAFHSGQMYGFMNDYTQAIKKFELSFDPNEPIDAPLLWNVYVDATIAFLQKNKEKLLAERKKLGNGSDLNLVNLNVIDGFINCFEKPYSEAYTKCRPSSF